MKILHVIHTDKLLNNEHLNQLLLIISLFECTLINIFSTNVLIKVKFVTYQTVRFANTANTIIFRIFYKKINYISLK